ncbi:unnamed protein product, partial [Tilletia caries]
VENSTGGGVAREHHDTADWIWDKHGGRGAKQGKKKESIKAYISRICHYYYTMDDILGDKANVKPPSLLEGGVRTQLQLANLATSKRKSAAKKDNGEDEEEDEDEEEEEEEEEEKEDEEEEDEEDQIEDEGEGDQVPHGATDESDLAESEDEEEGGYLGQGTES